MHERTRVVGGQRGLEFSSSLVVAERVGEGVDDPARVGVHDREVAARVVVERRRGRLRILGHPAHHGVGEAGCPRRHGAHQVDGGGDRSPGRHPGAPQLVGAEPQRVAHRRIDRCA